MKSDSSVCAAPVGTLFIVTAPSGAGKSSLLKALIQQDPSLGISVSHTTRAPRPGETDGRDYYFTTIDDFLARERNGEFLESAKVHGNYYATSRKTILDRLYAGQDTFLEIDWQGAQQIRKLIDHTISIFILPPSTKTLEERLYSRGQDSQEVISKRLLNATEEISHVSEFDYVIINDVFDVALSELAAIIAAARCRLSSQIAHHAALFRQLGVVID